MGAAEVGEACKRVPDSKTTNVNMNIVNFCSEELVFSIITGPTEPHLHLLASIRLRDINQGPEVSVRLVTAVTIPIENHMPFETIPDIDAQFISVTNTVAVIELKRKSTQLARV